LRHSYEIRVHLQWRIVLIQDGPGLAADDIMKPDEATLWLRGRRKPAAPKTSVRF